MDDKKIKVLLGFKLRNDKEDKETEKKLVTQIKTMGYEPSFFVRTTKRDVVNYLSQNKDCKHVILMETIGQSTWSQNELADLVDERNLNIVIILTAQRAKQLEYLTTLYAAGITSAIFEQGRGVPAEEVAELVIKQRSRKAAREYYRIDTKNISIRSLTNEMYNGLVVKLMDDSYGPSTMSRLLTLAGSLNPYQMGDFLTKLPDEVVRELFPYAEYAQLVMQLKESGIKVPYKRSKVYKSMDDDVPFNASAKEVLDERGMNSTPFIPKEPSKMGLFKRRKDKKEVADAPTIPVKENTNTVEQARETVIENLSAYHDWAGNETHWEEPPATIEDEEDEFSMDLSEFRKNGITSPSNFISSEASASVNPTDNTNFDGDDELDCFI